MDTIAALALAPMILLLRWRVLERDMDFLLYLVLLRCLYTRKRRTGHHVFTKPWYISFVNATTSDEAITYPHASLLIGHSILVTAVSPYPAIIYLHSATLCLRSATSHFHSADLRLIMFRHVRA